MNLEQRIIELEESTKLAKRQLSRRCEALARKWFPELKDEIDRSDKFEIIGSHLYIKYENEAHTLCKDYMNEFLPIEAFEYVTFYPCETNVNCIMKVCLNLTREQIQEYKDLPQ